MSNNIERLEALDITAIIHSMDFAPVGIPPIYKIFWKKQLMIRYYQNKCCTRFNRIVRYR